MEGEGNLIIVLCELENTILSMKKELSVVLIGKRKHYSEAKVIGNDFLIIFSMQRTGL